MALWTKLSAIALTPKLHNMPLRELEMTRKAFYATNVHVSESSRSGAREKKLPDGPSLKDFMTAELQNPSSIQPSLSTDVKETIPYLEETDLLGKDRKVYFETYGCQMNVNDTEVAWSILKDAGYKKTTVAHDADVILTVTCSVRDNAERKVWSRLDYFKSLKRKRSRKLPPLQVGVLGCMAERLKRKILETDKMVDVVAGPDAYRDLPRLLSVAEEGQTGVNVMLSIDETYADVMPVRLNASSPTAFVSIMRGCENMCSFCIVPFTRGRERSRPVESILEEVRQLSDQGVKEVTLLGQNVNSYRDLSQSTVPLTHSTTTNLSRGFKTIYKSKEGGRRFADLLDKVARVDPEIRVRFTSPHPKDFPDELLSVITERHNVCKSVHLPAQSGNNEVLASMRRGYTREAYLDLVERVRSTVSGVTLSSDFMAGFCGESESAHSDTLSLMESVRYDIAYLFAYSMRQKTHAYHKLSDDVPHEVKQRRLRELIEAHQRIASEQNSARIGEEHVVLVEKRSKRSHEDLSGRNDGNIKVIFPNTLIPSEDCTGSKVKVKSGDYVVVKITGSSSYSLKGAPLQRTILANM